jgi:hypothetical protein
MVLIGDGVKWNLVSVYLEIVLILAQDKYTVCAESTMGMEIILGHLMVFLGYVGQVEVRFCSFGDSVNLSAR